MATYIVGDIQGCLTPLLCLLEKVQFNPDQDRLWSVGDIVNRGPNSLGTVRFLMSLGKSFQMVLGNHDLHLLAIAFGVKTPKKGDTLDEILQAPDREAIIEWLRQQPLLFQEGNNVVVHAGIPPIWSIEEAASYSQEVESALRGNNPSEFLREMYGNEPTLWSESLTDMTRLRVITNYLTRMRVCTPKGALDLHYKGNLENSPEGFHAWFDLPHTPNNSKHIFFGHWAALQAGEYGSFFHALDSGCVWGEHLTLLQLESGERFTCACR